MGQILEINGEFFVEFYGNGLKFQKKAGSTYKEAQDKLEAIEQSISATALDVDVATVTADMFFERYLEYAKQVHHTVSYHRFRHALEDFRQFLDSFLSKDCYLKEIIPKTIELYKENLVRTYEDNLHLVNFTLYLVRDILQYSITLGWLNDNPTFHTPFIDEGAKVIPQVYDDKHIGYLQGLHEGRNLSAFDFLLYTGMTLDELAQLKWESIDISNQLIEVSTFFKDSQTIRSIPMDHQMLDILKTMDKPDDSDQLVFTELSLHSEVNLAVLRNTFCRNLLKRGVTLSQLYKYLGVHDIAKVFRYYVYLPH